MTIIPNTEAIHLIVHDRWLPVLESNMGGVFLCTLEASHFRGATIQWRPVNSNGSAFIGEVSRVISQVNMINVKGSLVYIGIIY